MPNCVSPMISGSELLLYLSTFFWCTTILSFKPLADRFHSVAHKQRFCISNSRCWFCQFLAIYRCLNGGLRAPCAPHSRPPWVLTSTIFCLRG